jgi:tetratricopeptide (TPR) repeat protein
MVMRTSRPKGLLSKYLCANERAASAGGLLAIGGLLRAKIEFRKCEVLLLAGHTHQVVDIGQKLVNRYKWFFLPELLGDLYGLLSNAFLMLSDYPSMEEAAKSSISLQFQAGNTASIASCRNSLGVMYEDTGRPALALEQYQQALELYEKVNDQTGIGGSLVNIGTVLNGLKQAEESEAAFRRAIDILEQSWDKVTLGFAYSNYSVLLARQGRRDEMMKCLERSTDIQRQIGDHYGLGFSLANIAGQQFRNGQWSRAMATLGESIVMRESIGERLYLTGNYFELGRLLMELGRYDEARLKMKRSIALGNEVGHPERSAAAWLLLAELAHRQGDHKLMRLHLDQAAGCLPGITEEARFQILDAYCRLGRGDAAGALQVLTKLQHDFEGLSPRLRAEVGVLDAQYGCSIKNEDQSIRVDFEQAVTLARESEAEGIHILANVLLQYGEWLASAGGDTKQVLSEAEGLFLRMGNEYRLKRVAEIRGKSQSGH